VTNDDASEITFSDLYRILRDAWLGIAILTLLGGAAGLVVAVVQKPVYRAEVLLSPANAQDSSVSTLSRLAEQFAPGVAGNVGGAGGFTGKDVWIATLRSRRLADEFIRGENLLPVLFAERWDSETGQWRLRKDGRPWEPSLDDAYALFTSEILTVTEDTRTGLVRLAIEWPDREVVAEWANSIVMRANEFIRARMVAESQQSIEFLEAELKKTDVVALQQTIYRLIEARIGDAVVANVRKEYAFSVVDPAVTPRPQDFVRPRRRFIVAFGMLMGLLVGTVYAGARWARRPRKSETVGAASSGR
jgi:uncharacterized protein involved in exopolysaccharide biosynthesis